MDDAAASTAWRHWVDHALHPCRCVTESLCESVHRRFQFTERSPVSEAFGDPVHHPGFISEPSGRDIVGTGGEAGGRRFDLALQRRHLFFAATLRGFSLRSLPLVFDPLSFSSFGFGSGLCGSHLIRLHPDLLLATTGGGGLGGGTAVEIADLRFQIGGGGIACRDAGRGLR